MKWISVKDQLPPDESYFLVVIQIFDTHERFQDVIYVNPLKSYLFEGFRGINDKNFRRITHWMELPSLPG